MTSKHDIIVVGAGLSGLYSAYNIKKMFPKINLLVLESNQSVMLTYLTTSTIFTNASYFVMLTY